MDTEFDSNYKTPSQHIRKEDINEIMCKMPLNRDIVGRTSVYWMPISYSRRGSKAHDGFLFPNKITVNQHQLQPTFIEEVLADYEDLQKTYSGIEMMATRENPGWRNDFRFLFELCEAYNFFQMKGKWSHVKRWKLPFLYSARWNSQAIFAMIAFFFLYLKWRDQLKATCDFIANT